jgi:glutamate--cysteine ligase
VSALSHTDLDREQLLRFFEAAERPDESTHLIGTELEKFGVSVPAEGPIQPADFEHHILPTLQSLVEQFGWQPGEDKGEASEMVALTRDGASITLEPGGQFELSGKPLRNVHETCAEFTEHYRELEAISTPLRLSWMTAGHHPWVSRDEVPRMPKGRYRVMRSYLPTRGTRALDMMLRTCTVQANFDYASEAQCADRFRLSVMIAPVITAIFANSPYIEGIATGARSNRAQVWTDVDADRCGVPAFVFEGPLTYERYADWALDVPMFFVKRAGTYHPHHVPFRRFLQDGFTDPTGAHHRAEYGDWVTHLSTLFPEVRLKPHLEFRAADSVPSRFVCALPALLKGLLYSDDGRAAAWEAVGPLDPAIYLERRELAAQDGLGADPIRDMALQLLNIARQTLDRFDVRDDKGRTEARFIDPLQPLVETASSSGSEVLEALGPAPGRDAEARRHYVRCFHFAGVIP